MISPTFYPLSNIMPIPPAPQLFNLSYLQCMEVTGPNAKDFLQGQVTCDIKQLTPTQIQSGALCDLKGRVLALIDIIEWDKILIVYPTSLYKIIRKALDMPARLSRVNLEPAPTLICYGLIHPNTSSLPFNLPTQTLQLLSDAHVACYSNTPQSYILIGEASAIAAKTQDLPLAPHFLWHQHLLEHQLMSIYPETSGQFLPQRLNLDKSSYVSFNKGCYKGQEIIARMHYRGVNKYQLIVTCIETKQTLVPGMPIMLTQTAQPIGELIDMQQINENEYWIMVSVLEAEKEQLLTSSSLVDRK